MRKLRRVLQLMVCIGLMATFVGCATTTTKRESAGEYIDDAVITTKVKSAFAADPMVKAYQVNIETYKGVVQLSGFVDNQEQIKKAEQLAKSVGGVTDVKNNILIKK